LLNTNTTTRRLTPLVLALALLAPALAPADAPAAWIARSNENAALLMGAFAKFIPEQAGQLGLPGLEEQVFDLKPQLLERQQAALREALAQLEARLAAETDANVRQDLQILIQSTRDQIEGNELNARYQVVYFDVPQTVFQGIRALLDDQVPEASRGKAVVRLKRYAGLEPGYTPITVLAQDRMRESLAHKDLAGPFGGEVQKHLDTTSSYVDGIAKLFVKFGLKGYEPAHAKLKQQLAEYDAFVKAEILPRARKDFRLPPAIYAYSLKQYGVDVPPDDLATRARVGFVEIRNEMKTLAPLVAREKGFAATDYRDVIRELKKQQIVGDAILPLYQRRIRDMEEIIRRNAILTLPQREARVRLASEAESAAIPAPNLRPPRLIGNTGEMGEFVLPLRVPTSAGAGSEGGVKAFDDFSFEAASWTLTAHEARPGHELQFAAVIEKGVSLARALFAANSTNIEGWGLYAEAEAKPYEPLDGQLIALQHRLMRAARAFLDPDLQAGRITPDAATRFLMDEVVLSEPMAKQEVDRYTFRAPGQATSYFYGYTRWMQLKAETELALGKSFNRQRYHDFLLAQGTLPPSVISQAVVTEFIPAEKARAGAPPAAVVN
jgi:hypothetical protein